jgi:predicted PurR-regulated permease PerM
MPEVSRSVTQWLRKRPLFVRIVAYATIVILALALATGAGAIGALTLRDGLDSPERERPQPLDEQQNDRQQQERALLANK